MPRGRFRVKLVMPSGPDAHYFYRDTYTDALDARDTLLAEIPNEASPAIYVYVETSFGHVRLA